MHAESGKAPSEQLTARGKKRQEALKKKEEAFHDNYNDFMVFEPEDPKVVITVCFAILDYNKNAEQQGFPPFLVFFDVLMERIAAATKIQLAFRSYLAGRHEEKQFLQSLVRRRAATCI